MTSQKSYDQILKSSSIMGGAASITMILGMVKTKFAAVLIGTNGIGLLANFMAIQGFITTIASLGINSSAVREVAAAVEKGDKQAIGRAVLTLRRMCWLTGIFGMVIVVALSPMICQLTFGTDSYNLEIASLGLVVLFTNISGGQVALIRGSRRIGDVARISIFSAVVSTAITIAFYIGFGLRGIAPALVFCAAVNLLISWLIARRIPVPPVDMTWRQSFDDAGSMVKLGIAMMWTGLVSSLVGYATIVIIRSQFDLHAVGIYSAAFALSGMFVNFVLQAMGTDYYPRLSGVADDKAAMNKLVNEQTEIGLLLTVPGILATLVLAPWIIHVFYTKAFLPASELLQWFILGCFIRVIQWPIGFLQLALGRGKVWVTTQTLLSILHLVLIWFASQYFGITGVAIAFCALYLVSLWVVKGVGRYLTGFMWGRSVKSLLLKLVPAVFAVFLIENYLVGWWAFSVSFSITLIFSLYSLRELINRIGVNHLLTRILVRVPLLRRLIFV